MSLCKFNCFKVIFAIGNILILALGVVFIVTASYDCQIYSDIEEIVHLKELSFVTKFGLTPLMVVGGILIVVSFIGVCGIICRSTIALILYSILMLAMAGLLGYTCGMTLGQERTDISKTITNELTVAFAEQRLKAFSISFDKLETDYQCCGIDGPKDYAKVMAGGNVPITCCEDQTLKHCSLEESYQDGCAVKLTDYTVRKRKITAGLGISTAFIMVCFAIAGFWYGIRAICCL